MKLHSDTLSRPWVDQSLVLLLNAACKYKFCNLWFYPTWIWNHDHLRASKWNLYTTKVVKNWSQLTCRLDRLTTVAELNQLIRYQLILLDIYIVNLQLPNSNKKTKKILYIKLIWTVQNMGHISGANI